MTGGPEFVMHARISFSALSPFSGWKVQSRPDFGCSQVQTLTFPSSFFELIPICSEAMWKRSDEPYITGGPEFVMHAPITFSALSPFSGEEVRPTT